jgi:hypothetical protein
MFGRGKALTRCFDAYFAVNGEERSPVPGFEDIFG